MLTGILWAVVWDFFGIHGNGGFFSEGVLKDLFLSENQGESQGKKNLVRLQTSQVGPT